MALVAALSSGSAQDDSQPRETVEQEFPHLEDVDDWAVSDPYS